MLTLHWDCVHSRSLRESVRTGLQWVLGVGTVFLTWDGGGASIYFDTSLCSLELLAPCDSH